MEVKEEVDSGDGKSESWRLVREENRSVKEVEVGADPCRREEKRTGGIEGEVEGCRLYIVEKVAGMSR